MRFVAGLILAAALGAAPALAQAPQKPWTFDGIAFVPRDGWCSKVTSQIVSGDTTVEAMEMRPCDSDFPYLSVGVGRRQSDKIDIVALMTRVGQAMEGEAGRNNVLETFKRVHASCTIATYEVDRAPLQGVNAVEVRSSASCPGLSDPTVWYRNFSAFVQRGNGDLWAVAFDSPLTARSEADEQMIRAAVATIATN
jgi:hypothetical protein